MLVVNWVKSARILRRTCKFQDGVGEIRRILRAVPFRKSVFSDRLPTRIPVPISPTPSWNLQWNVNKAFLLSVGALASSPEQWCHYRGDGAGGARSLFV